ncbi:AraC-like DNA-binding protein [Nocardia transvalensis]|uniref:AraC-like DNA-binding protein n=1 Tax=Nocardia transvalensis TaxID=37333 RepID=A0A7W9UHY1_9NOCA|nr:helix-turn-helix domain-containing protein [Nocardia transvalensis]MBB5913681.1 AraC-like DNA-binding protein [Nocardia transvalensis]
MTTLSAAPMHTVERFARPLPVPDALRPWFTGGESIPFDPGLTVPFVHIPDATTRLVVRDDREGHRDMLVIGPLTRATYKAAAEPVSCVRLRLAPGAATAVLGVPAAELTDRAVRIDRLPGPLGALAGELAEATPDEVPALLESLLAPRLSPAPADHRALLRAAMALLSATSASIPAVAAELAVSERHLRSVFASGIGLSPKHFARIRRVRRLLATAERAPLAQLAADQGYYDQSHMTADFRTLMGVPPTSYFEGRTPGPTPCGVLLRG